MSFEQPEHPVTSQDIPPIQTPIAAAPITFMSAPPNNRATMPDTGLPSLPTTGIEQANGTSNSPTEDTTAQPPSAPVIDGARLSPSELDDAVNASPLRDVDPQIVEALRGKDRIYVLKLGELMEGLINDERRQRIELAPASTYQRLLVHRCSAYYKLVPETEPNIGVSSPRAHCCTSIQNYASIIDRPSK
ncbi:hypothetical protein P691DRAFT_443888 [Macrolepiota fuliginosa MF-IS2]|uniref:R3H domain-containing protein n=1 Tax=Macrolepiota fuliginosa MF-IS2 TaxID=1400762 RepID=A0A9P6CAM7_9AGAR|nr:hypothetical protein P691DRAFT_443888 [Macrolepiota fuliginosa MF-IS2]